MVVADCYSQHKHVWYPTVLNETVEKAGPVIIISFYHPCCGYTGLLQKFKAGCKSLCVSYKQHPPQDTCTECLWLEHGCHTVWQNQNTSKMVSCFWTCLTRPRTGLYVDQIKQSYILWYWCWLCGGCTVQYAHVGALNSAVDQLLSWFKELWQSREWIWFNKTIKHFLTEADVTQFKHVYCSCCWTQTVFWVCLWAETISWTIDALKQLLD